MKVVYCIQDICRLGGMERVLSKKVNYLAQHGYDVMIITTDQQGKSSYYSLDDRIVLFDLDINYSLSKNRWEYHKCIVKHKARLTVLLYKLQADIVISMFGQETEFLPSIKDGSKKILELHYTYSVVMPHLSGLRGLYHNYKNRKRAKNIKKYDRFIVLTQEDKNSWKGFDNIDVIPNSQTFDCNQPAKLENRRVIAVGRYHAVKGYDRLIQAWSLVNQECKDWTLHIVGEGTLRKNLQAQIDRLGLDQYVFLDGASQNIKNEYLSSSILALTSFYEGFGLVILEAMTCGVPVVSFSCPCGPKDLIVDGKNGFLVSNGDISELANRLLFLIRHSSERKKMGEEAHTSAKRFSEDKVMLQWMTLFDIL